MTVAQKGTRCCVYVIASRSHSMAWQRLGLVSAHDRIVVLLMVLILMLMLMPRMKIKIKMRTMTVAILHVHCLWRRGSWKGGVSLSFFTSPCRAMLAFRFALTATMITITPKINNGIAQSKCCWISPGPAHTDVSLLSLHSIAAILCGKGDRRSGTDLGPWPD